MPDKIRVGPIRCDTHGMSLFETERRKEAIHHIFQVRLQDRPAFCARDLCCRF